MITGDNALTAAFIGQQLAFGNGSSLFAAKANSENTIEWQDLNEKVVTTTKSAAEVATLSKSHQLCINGDILSLVILFSEAGKQVRHMHIFSRTSPAQKGMIVGLLNQEGHKTLMCGDGTNDVGSLKRADVGLAIVNGKEPSKA